MARITHIVVHYSATARGQHVTVADIDGWHRKRGFRKIGYHYVIYLDGSIHKGRDEAEIGAHVKGQNTGKIGICWVGGTEPGKPNDGVDTRTPAQKEALIELIHDLLSRYPKAQVVGHRDLAATQCPGFDVIPWWAAGREESAAQPPNPNLPTKTPEEQNGYKDPAGETGNGPTVPVAGALAGVGFGVVLWDTLGWIGLVVVGASIAFVIFRFKLWRIFKRKKS